MDIAYIVPGLMVLAAPALTLLGFVASFFYPAQLNRDQRFAIHTKLVVLYIALCTFAWITLHHDPGNVVEWWLD